VSRSLTVGEIRIAQVLFKNAIDYQRVKVHNGKYIFLQVDNSAIAPNGEIYAHGIYSIDYAKESGAMRGFFIHEMTHVWQYQNKICNLIVRAIWDCVKSGLNYKKTYCYTLEVDKDLVSYGMEQQAAIIEDYYRINVEGLVCRTARIKNNETEAALNKLYEQVLEQFLSNPNL